MTLWALGATLGLLWAAMPATAGMLGHWPLNDGSGDTVANLATGGTTGQITNADSGGLGENGSVWVDDPAFGTVISFDGTADGAFVSAGSIPKLDLESNFTWTFWAKQSGDNADPNQNDIIVGNRKDANGEDFSPLQFIKFTPTRFEWYANGNGDDIMPYHEPIPGGEWVHHAVVKRGTELIYFRNCESEARMEITQPMDFEMPLFFGGDNTQTVGENWAGYLADVRIFDNALAPPQIEDVKSAIPEPSTGTLMLIGLLPLFRRRRRSHA